MVTLIAYVMGAGFFLALDYAQWPHFLYKYKINPGKNAPPEMSKVIKVRHLANTYKYTVLLSIILANIAYN